MPRRYRSPSSSAPLACAVGEHVGAVAVARAENVHRGGGGEQLGVGRGHQPPAGRRGCRAVPAGGVADHHARARPGEPLVGEDPVDGLAELLLLRGGVGAGRSAHAQREEHHDGHRDDPRVDPRQGGGSGNRQGSTEALGEHASGHGRRACQQEGRRGTHRTAFVRRSSGRPDGAGTPGPEGAAAGRGGTAQAERRRRKSAARRQVRVAACSSYSGRSGSV